MICSVLGTPSDQEFPNIEEYQDRLRKKGKSKKDFKHHKGQALSSVLPNASREALRVLEKMLKFHPQG